MKKVIHAIVVVIAISASVAAYAQNNKMIYSVESCQEGDGIVTKVEVWAVPGDSVERSVCEMGVDCQGRAWSTCGAISTANQGIATLSAAFASAIAGDSARRAAGDPHGHIVELIVRDAIAYVRADRHVYYKVFAIAKGTVVFDDPRLARAGTMVALATPGSTLGPHLVVAYDPETDRAQGYRVYLR